VVNVASDNLLSIHDFSEFLHALRSRELRRLPAGACTIISGGCAGDWYFLWFNDHFQGQPEHHYGVELFADAPAGLPPEVTWLRQSLGSMRGIGEGEADLVFAGEVTEHLWPDDIAGLLAESWRVRKPGGVIALDSPNRIVCQAQRWTHPEHTLEFSVEEIVRLLRHAGFEDVAIRGVWLCYDRDRHQALRFDDLDGQSIDRASRIDLAEDRPEDAFVWWAQAVRGASAPDVGRLRDELAAMYSAYRPERLARLLPTAPRERWDPVLGRVVSGDQGVATALFHGPYVPIAPGAWQACFRLALVGGTPRSPQTVVADIEVTVAGEAIASRSVAVKDLAPGGSMTEVCVAFDCVSTQMGVEFRLISTGAELLDAPLEVTVRRREELPSAAPAPAFASRETPEREPAAPEARSRGRRLLTWPIRRSLNPRMRLLHRNIERVEARVMARLDEIARMLR